MATATPTKLRSGEWGARVQGRVEAGEEITIRTKGGKSWTAIVAKVIWSGKDKYRGGMCSIVATESQGRRSGYTERGHYDGYCGYPCPVSGRKCCPANGPCHDCI